MKIALTKVVRCCTLVGPLAYRELFWAADLFELRILMKIQKYLLVVVGALIVGTGSAQTWTVNGLAQSSNLISSSAESAVAINPIDGAVALKTATGGPVLSVSVSAPATASVNQAISVSWSNAGFTGTVICTASSVPTVSGWNGVVSSSPVLVTMPANTGNVSLSLSCAGSNGTQVGGTNVTVGATPTCPPFPSYNNVQYNVETISFNSAFAANFPAYNNQYSFPLGPGFGTAQGQAIEFIAPAVTEADGLFQMALTTGGGGSGVPITSISKCAGQWGTNLNDVGGNGRTCFKLSGEDGPEWTVNNNLVFSGARCLLVPGERYYLNIAFDNCTASACSFRVFSRRSSQEVE
jgi:hypothetical protein